ncbi:uncharacterized protein LOC141883551 [Acropora palmata]|uniref:uncharacterized protein LOC141883551 n=1 Tax=Acropora palmata TaxID=6131 RepID=UPI003DA0FB33
MADGARFPVPRFNSHNQHIPRSFSSKNPALYGKFQGPATGIFSSQSTTSSVNTVRRHVPQSFAGQGHKQDNTRRFLPQFPQNHRDIQQHRPPMGLPSSNVHQKPMPESQLTNKDTQLENATGFPTSRQFQVLPRNSQTNVDGKLLQMSNPTSSSSYPPHGQPLLQNNFSQAPSQIPPMAFPVPFSGPISVPPPPVPLPFPTPLPGNIVSPAMPLSVAPIIQPVDVPKTKTSEVSSQEWIDNFLKERGIEKQRTQTSCQSHLKLHEAKQLMAEWTQLISELSLQKDKLDALATGSNDLGWRQELEKAQKLKSRVEQIQGQFSHDEIEHLHQQVLKRKKKREWQKRKRKEEFDIRKETMARTSALHRKIDKWRSRITAEDEAKRKAESMKHEAGGVLGEVKRKQTDATKAVELLKALTKLREARKQEAEVKGVYIKPTEEQNRKFEERVKWLENVMMPRRELYEAEEKTLRVMLAEEEEEKEKERLENERKKQESLGLSDQMDWFRSYYQQAEHSIPSLLQIRRQWDAFLVPSTFPGASRIPDGFVSPAEPSSELWKTALIDKG